MIYFNISVCSEEKEDTRKELSRFSSRYCNYLFSFYERQLIFMPVGHKFEFISFPLKLFLRNL